MKFNYRTSDEGDYIHVSAMRDAYESFLLRSNTSDALKNNHNLSNIDMGGGSVAIDEDETVVAWLKVIQNKPDVGDGFLSIYLFYNIDIKRFGYVIKNLYSVEIEKLNLPYCEHKVYCSAYDRDLMQIWFELGFGLEQAYGHAKLDDLIENTKSNDHLELEALNKENAKDFEQFYPCIATVHARAPVFSGISEDYLRKLQEGFKNVVDDKDAIAVLAYRDNAAVGYQLWSLEGDDLVELSVGATIASERGKGVARALTEHCAKRVRKLGYLDCIIDWRTANPSSASFWPSIGFEPFKYRLVRRLSPKAIDDARKIAANDGVKQFSNCALL